MTASLVSARRSRIVPRLSYDERSAYLFVLPLAAVLFIVAVFPIVYSFYISLYSLKLTRPWKVPFVGFDNYQDGADQRDLLGFGRAHRQLHADVGRSPSASSRSWWRCCSTRTSRAAAS